MYRSADQLLHEISSDEEDLKENAAINSELQSTADALTKPEKQHSANLDTFLTLPSPPPTAIELSLLYTAHPLSQSAKNAPAYMLDLCRAGRSSIRYPIAPDGIIPNSKIRKFYRPFESCSQQPPETKSEPQLQNFPDEVRMKKLMDKYLDQLEEPTKFKLTSKNVVIRNFPAHELETKITDTITVQEESHKKSVEENLKTFSPIKRRQINTTTKQNTSTAMTDYNSRFDEFARNDMKSAASVKEEVDLKSIESEQTVVADDASNLDSVVISPPTNEVSLQKRNKANKIQKKERRNKKQRNKRQQEDAVLSEVKIIDAFHLKSSLENNVLSAAQSNLQAENLRLLASIVAETWFTQNDVPLDVESVVLALLSLMSEAQHAIKHEAMCARLLQIKEQMPFSTEFELKVLKELLRQMDKLNKEVKRETSGRSQTVEEMRSVLLRLLLKKLDNLVKVLNSFGEDTTNIRAWLETLRAQKAISEITLPQDKLPTNDVSFVSESLLKPLLLAENTINAEVATMMVIYDNDTYGRLQQKEEDDDDGVETDVETKDELNGYRQTQQLFENNESLDVFLTRESNSDSKFDDAINWSASPVSNSSSTKESSGIFTVSTEYTMQSQLRLNPYQSNMIGRDDSFLENYTTPSVDVQISTSSNRQIEAEFTNDRDQVGQHNTYRITKKTDVLLFGQQERETDEQNREQALKSQPQRESEQIGSHQTEISLMELPQTETLSPTGLSRLLERNEEEFLPGMDDIVFNGALTSINHDITSLNTNSKFQKISTKISSNFQNEKIETFSAQNQLQHASEGSWYNVAPRREVTFAGDEISNKKHDLASENKKQYGVDFRYLVHPSSIPSSEWSRICSGTFGRKNSATFCGRSFLPDIANGGLLRPEHCRYEQLVRRGLHKPGISVSRHLDRYDLIDSLYGYRSTT